MKRSLTFILVFILAVLGFYLGRTTFRSNSEKINNSKFASLPDLPKPPASDNSLQPLNPDSETITPIKSGDVPVSLAWLAARCGQTVWVKRTISSLTPAYQSVLKLLIKGPDASEETAGLISLIPASTILKSVAIDGDGLLTADFNKLLLKNIKNSCEAAALRQQITATLERFPEVRTVNILVNGLVPTLLIQPSGNANSALAN